MSDANAELADGARLTVGAVAQALGGVLARGDSSLELTGVAGLREAGPGELSFVAGGPYVRLAAQTEASALLIPQELDVPPGCGAALIRVPDVEGALERLGELFAPPVPAPEPGVHPRAVVSDSAVLGEGVSVGPFAVIEGGVRVGDRTVIGPQVFLGHGSTVGADTHLAAGVKVRHGCEIGDHVILHPGVVIGGDGFGYRFADGVHRKIPQTGRVVIGDDVEIGSNTTVDRARLGVTRIGRGTKIDNLVMIAHNVQIGEHCIITGQCGIAGSTVLGDYVMVGAQVGINGHIRVGDGAQIAARSGIRKSVPPGARMSGLPAQAPERANRTQAAIKKLPDLVQAVRELRRKVDALERGGPGSPGPGETEGTR